MPVLPHYHVSRYVSDEAGNDGNNLDTYNYDTMGESLTGLHERYNNWLQHCNDVVEPWDASPCDLRIRHGNGEITVFEAYACTYSSH